MARDPHEAVDFAPAWLNFNNSNKKKAERTSGIHPLSQSSTFSLSSPLRPSQEPLYRANSLGLRSNGSPSQSMSNVHWGHPHSPSTRSGIRHQSVDFSPSYLENKNDHLGPNREFSRSGAYSPTLIATKRDFSASNLTWLSKNGRPLHHHKSGSGDSTSGIDTDFPSLSDTDSSEQSKNKNSSGQQSPAVINMWKKPLVLKSKVRETTSALAESSKCVMSSSIYKTLVPKTCVPHQKQPYRRTMSVPLVFLSKSGNSNGEFITSGSRRENSVIKAVNQSTTGKLLTANTSSLRQARSELQSTVAKNAAANIGAAAGHQKHCKGKNHFLNALRQNEEGGESAKEMFEEKAENRGTVQSFNNTKKHRKFAL